MPWRLHNLAKRGLANLIVVAYEYCESFIGKQTRLLCLEEESSPRHSRTQALTIYHRPVSQKTKVFCLINSMYIYPLSLFSFFFLTKLLVYLV